MNISYSGQSRRKLALSKCGQLYPVTEFYRRRKWEVLIESRLTLEALEMCSLLCRKLSCLCITVGSRVQVFTEHWNRSRWSGKRQSLGVWIKCICTGTVIMHSAQYYSKQDTECREASPFFCDVTWTTGRWLLWPSKPQSHLEDGGQNSGDVCWIFYFKLTALKTSLRISQLAHTHGFPSSLVDFYGLFL